MHDCAEGTVATDTRRSVVFAHWTKRAVAPRIAGRFFGKNAGDAKAAFAGTRKAVLTAQFFAHEHEEAVTPAAAQVVAAHFGRIAPPAGAAGGDNGNAPGARRCQQMRFLSQAVDGVDNSIERLAREKLFRCRLRVEAVENSDFRRRINGENPLAQDIRFGPPEVVLRRR